jgi:hypothetical protein
MSLQDKAEELLGLLHTSQNPTVAKPALKSGEAVENVSGVNQEYLVAVQGAAKAGEVTIAIGPTEAVADTVVNKIKQAAESGGLFRVPVPAGWWIKVTVAEVTINSTTTVSKP